LQVGTGDSDVGTSDPRPGLGGWRRPRAVQAGIGAAELAIYLLAALLLLFAAGFVLVGAVTDLIEGSQSRDIADAGVFALDRILLLFIIAELLYTLRLVILGGGQILVEPFLFIGLIAVVRRILVATAEFEGRRGRAEVTDFVIQIGGLAGLAFALTLAIYLLRRSSVPQER
jgi:uncharacterized membrane protein (DUF373 family)